MAPNNVSAAGDSARLQLRQLGEWASRGCKSKAQTPVFIYSVLQALGRNPFEGRLRHLVRFADGTQAYADFFLPGVLLVGTKAAGSPDFRNGKADDQAFRCARNLHCGRWDLPQFIMVSDFRHIRVYDMRPALEDDTFLVARPEPVCFDAKDFEALLDLFAPLATPGKRTAVMARDADEVSIAAAELLASLHAQLVGRGFSEEQAGLFVLRVLFCLFADAAGLFGERGILVRCLAAARKRGSALVILQLLFEEMGSPAAATRGQVSLPCLWDAEQPGIVLNLPFGTDRLFAGQPLPPVPLSETEAAPFLDACLALDWSGIVPTLLGTNLFLRIRSEGRPLPVGGHGTDDSGRLWLERPLFLDGLTAEFDAIRNIGDRKWRLQKMMQFHVRLGNLTFLDPACGSGAFLAVALRELRRLELEVLAALADAGRLPEPAELCRVRPCAFHGMDKDPIAAAMTRTVLFMTDHLCTVELSERLGIALPDGPMAGSEAVILEGNALRLDWKTAFEDMAGKSFDYIMGFAPHARGLSPSQEQKEDMCHVFGKDFGQLGRMSYTSAWFWLAARYMQSSPKTRTAFAAEHSITIGRNPAMLWNRIHGLMDQSILFARRKFAWKDARRREHRVHAVIIGFGADSSEPRLLWMEPQADAAGSGGDPSSVQEEPVRVSSISGRLAADVSPVCVKERDRPLCDVPEIRMGNHPVDGGHYFFTTQERDAFLGDEPGAAPYFRRWVGSREYLHGTECWCLRAADIEEDVLAGLPRTRERIEAVRSFRLQSRAPRIRSEAAMPAQFHATNIPAGPCIVLPGNTTGRRQYAPVGMTQPAMLYSNNMKLVRSSDLYDFGVLQSSVFMAWGRSAAGSRKNRFEFDTPLVYNTFPWPEPPAEEQKDRIRALAQAVLDARAAHPGKSLAELYDPESMPDELREAHAALDRAVIGLYGETWSSEEEIAAGLFGRYAALVRGRAVGKPAPDEQCQHKCLPRFSLWGMDGLTPRLPEHGLSKAVPGLF
ncbi:MAG: hypothetical protein Q4F72_05685 [Desulfovibrionaceae bacterium]|nr:hypothetical protein [Desulfovibrionaceae bacterium]